jgi:hypothetical protein
MTRSRFVLPPLVQLAAVLAVALALGPARSQETGLNKADDTKRMVDLLGSIDRRLANLETRSDATMDLIKNDLKQLREEVGRLQREVADLRRTPPPPSTSNYPAPISPPPPGPSTSYSAPQPPLLGHVRLVNTYFTDMTAVVNGQLHVVPAGQTREVPVPAGSVTYQVAQVPRPAQTRALAPNETLTLTLFPQ